MITTEQIERNAAAVRNAGIEDRFNRWLKMTPEAFEENQRSRDRIAAAVRNPTSTREKTVQNIGPKEQQLRDSRKPNGAAGSLLATASAIATAATKDANAAAAEVNAAVKTHKKKPHPADAALALIAEAVSFTASLFHDKQHHKREGLKTIPEARIAGEALRVELNSSRDYIVYAVLKDGRSFPVPRDHQPAPAKQESDVNTKTAEKTAPAKAAAKTIKKPAAAKAPAKKAVKENARKPVSGATKAAKPDGTKPRKESKSDVVERMLTAAGGATRKALSDASGWPHVNLRGAAERAELELIEKDDHFRLVAKDAVEAAKASGWKRHAFK